MRTLLIAVAAWAAVPQLALAGSRPCEHPRMILTCTAVYRLEVGADLEGPSDAAIIQDREMEPFDPPVCEASVALFTDDGKFIATLNEEGKTLHAWLERGGRSETLANWIRLDADRWEANVASTAHGMSGMRFVCHVLEPRD